ncbi:MAG: 2-amino-4-hydroxy-6-hydroxymethyldihydropteridine diphosphokinase [Thermaurantiacus sp.]
MAPASSHRPPPPRRAVVALGSNMRHPRLGRSPAVLAAAVEALARGGFEVLAVAPVTETAPVGPSRRRFANGAVLGLWRGSAEELLELCLAVERAFGRRRRRRWGPRVLDCDLLLVGGEAARAPGRVGSGLVLPHPELHRRRFVLDPLSALWPEWRHPRLGLSVRQLRFRLARRRAVDSPVASA